MEKGQKTAQLQIRVSTAEKRAIQLAAKRAGIGVSAYVLNRLLPAAMERFQKCVEATSNESTLSFALAELNSFLSELTPGEMRDATAAAPSTPLNSYIANYIAAMVEYGCARVSIAPPPWTRAIEPLRDPVFATNLQSLRLHLLMRSPPPFRRRNIFIDSSLGARV
jgi:uncharacterized protein (DUF1778 family)